MQTSTNPYAVGGSFGQYKMMLKTSGKLSETLAQGYLSQNTHQELSNEYQHDRDEMVFKSLCVLVLWSKVASALEGLIVSLGGKAKLFPLGTGPISQRLLFLFPSCCLLGDIFGTTEAPPQRKVICDKWTLASRGARVLPNNVFYVRQAVPGIAGWRVSHVECVDVSGLWEERSEVKPGCVDSCYPGGSCREIWEHRMALPCNFFQLRLFDDIRYKLYFNTNGVTTKERLGSISHVD